MIKTGLRLSTALAVGAVMHAQGLEAQTPEAFVWTNATEVSFVSTGGNASSSTLGMKATLGGTGGVHTLTLAAGGVRGSTDFVTRTATGSPGSFTVIEDRESELTAENYFFRGRYERDLGAAYGFSGAGWDRNTFAGVQNRYAFVAGLGRTWVEGESGTFKTDLGATYTIQKDVDPAPGADDAFGGIRLSVEAARPLSETADFASTLIVDENLEQTDDFRTDWTNSLSVSVSESLALKTSLQLLYDRLPSLLSVPLVDGSGDPTGTNVLSPGDSVDSVFTFTLVIKL